MRNIIVILFATLLAGCTTVSTTKTIRVVPQPGEDHVVVDTNASARCKEIIFFISCKLNLEVTQAGGDVAPVVSVPADSATSSATASRMEQLDELKAHKLVTEKEYQKKRQDILRDL